MKNPTIATVLNIIPGLGYIYIGGEKRLFGILLILSLIGMGVASFDPLLVTASDEAYYSAGFRIWDALNIAIFIVLLGAFMYDAYRCTVTRNLQTSVKAKR